ncbi:hypothetical protein U1Q18_007029 [Sarracenia purpurea var. burkii]
MGDAEEAARLAGLGQQNFQMGSPKKSLNRQPPVSLARKESRDLRRMNYSCDSEHLPEIEPVADSPPIVCTISVLDPTPTFSVQNAAKAMTITYQSKISSCAKSPRSVKAPGIDAINGKPPSNSKSNSPSLAQSTEKFPKTVKGIEKVNCEKGMKAPDNCCADGNPVSTDNPKVKVQDVSPAGATEALPNDESSFSQTTEAAMLPCRSL